MQNRSTAVNGQPQEVRLEKATNKLLSGLSLSAKGIGNVNINESISNGMTKIASFLNPVRMDDDIMVSDIVLLATKTSIDEGTLSDDGKVKSRKLVGSLAVESYERILSTTFANYNWRGAEDPDINFPFAMHPMLFEKMLTAGALYIDAVGDVNQPQLYNIPYSKELEEYFPEQEEVVYVYRICKEVDVNNVISYYLILTTIVLSFSRNGKSFIPNVQSYEPRYVCLDWDDIRSVPSVSLQQRTEPDQEKEANVDQVEENDYSQYDFDPADDF